MLKEQKYTENINPNIGKTMILSKCAICSSKKLRFIKNQEIKQLLSNVGVKTPLSKAAIRYKLYLQKWTW